MPRYSSSSSSSDSSDDESTPLCEEDATALRKLRDDDASGAIKKLFGNSKDPREWYDGYGDKAVTVKDDRVTTLSLYGCENLATLPAAV